MQGQALFPTDWPGTMDSPDASSTVRMRVDVKGKGVARRGATLFADDLLADGTVASAEPGEELMAEGTPDPPAAAVTETVAIEDSKAALMAEPSAEAMVEDKAAPVVEETVGYVTSELPRGASSSAAATALCSAAALQRLRHDA